MCGVGGPPIKVYRNDEVVRVVGFIPEGHSHMRLVVEFNDQVIVLQEATVAGIVRAYIDIHTHPTRKAVELISTRLSKDFRKAGYAEHQLIESSRTEGEVLREWCEKLFKKSTA
ncbi:MAG: hypothetical protein QXY36_03915 [Sulfolobales archaeon]